MKKRLTLACAALVAAGTAHAQQDVESQWADRAVTFDGVPAAPKAAGAVEAASPKTKASALANPKAKTGGEPSVRVPSAPPPPAPQKASLDWTEVLAAGAGALVGGAIGLTSAGVYTGGFFGGVVGLVAGAVAAARLMHDPVAGELPGIDTVVMAGAALGSLVGIGLGILPLGAALFTGVGAGVIAWSFSNSVRGGTAN